MVHIFGLRLWLWACMNLGPGLEVRMLVWADGVTAKSGFPLLLDVMSSRDKGSMKVYVIMLQFSVLWREKERFCFTCSQLFLVCVFWYECRFTCNFSLNSNFDLIIIFQAGIFILSFKNSASRNFNLFGSLLVADFLHNSFFALKLLII